MSNSKQFDHNLQKAKRQHRANRKKYIILDWAGNHKFKEKVFFSFELAFDFLLTKFPNDDDLQEFQIVQQ